VLVFVLSAVAAALLSIFVPIALLLLSAAAIAARQGIAAFRLFGLSLRSISATFRHCGEVCRCIFDPLTDSGPELDDSAFPRQWVRLSPPQFIELHRLQQQVAEAIGVPPAAELWMSPGVELGIGQTRSEGRAIRYLVVGLGLVRLLSAGELRAALAHEFGHARAGHLRLGRFVRHSVRMLLHAQLRFRWFDPAFWGSVVSLTVMQAIYLPWSRARELEADAISAQVAGSSPAIAALRRVREHGPALDQALDGVLQRAIERQAGPLRLVESAMALAALIPPAERRRLAVVAEGDPLALGGRTHPPTATRIAALDGIVARRRLPEPIAIPPERLAQLDERLTRAWLAPLGLRPQMPTDVAVHAVTEPAAFEHRTQTREELATPTTDGLELDLDRDWNKQR
jgi:Zn-dependent protease with chaperone function